jgi:hypothetical protein
LIEYGVLLPGEDFLDKEIFPRIEKHDTVVRLFDHEKHETLNTGVDGCWQLACGDRPRLQPHARNYRAPLCR